MKAKRYKVLGVATIIVEVGAEFEDDEKFDLNDQANDALRDSDDLPLGCRHDIDRIEIESIKEIQEGA